MDELKENQIISTEESIKEAAKVVFLKKGFAGTKTRDIAEQAGENLALINYYFRSKKNLFRIIMNEIAGEFMDSMIPVFNDPDTSIVEKVEKIVENYINLFMKQPDIPLFIMNELGEGSGCLASSELKIERILHSQFHDQIGKEYPNINPEHIIMNIVGMTIFPFIGKAMMNGMQGIDDEMFDQLMEERRKMIPMWVELMLKESQK
ncbi:TetR/AcrR family transcriptional regulator [bacterium SCSIO 12643]|nr:TetR/AcrR family transcriptional regulator [bacterium SCSIO 12643]